MAWLSCSAKRAFHLTSLCDLTTNGHMLRGHLTLAVSGWDGDPQVFDVVFDLITSSSTTTHPPPRLSAHHPLRMVMYPQGRWAGSIIRGGELIFHQRHDPNSSPTLHPAGFPRESYA